MDRCTSNLPIDGQSFRRVEVLTGAPRRRQWSAAEKARIVTESLELGAVASQVALRYGLHRNQLYAWRRERRGERRGIATGFVPVRVTDDKSTSPAGTIEIVIGDVVVRVLGGVDPAQLQQVLEAVRGAA